MSRFELTQQRSAGVRPLVTWIVEIGSFTSKQLVAGFEKLIHNCVLSWKILSGGKDERSYIYNPFLVMVSWVSDDQGAPALRAPRLLLPHHTDSPPSRVVADHLTIVIPEYMLRLLQRPHNARYVD